MRTEELILVSELCVYYKVKPQFIAHLHETGLIEVWEVENASYVHQNTVRDLERMVRLYHDLNVNPEGIDVVFNLLDRIDELQAELNSLRHRLQLYEDDRD